MKRKKEKTRSIPEALNQWREVADLIARTAGPSVEVVLHDLTDPVHSVVYVVNGTVTEREVGQGLRHLVVEMLEAEARGTDLLPLWWFWWKEKLIHCTTRLIRSADGALIGALCVNEDVSDSLEAFKALTGKLPGLKSITLTLPETDAILFDDELEPRALKPASSAKETVRDMAFKMIASLARERGFDGGSLNRTTRRNFVRELESRGVFLVKGSIEETASVLGVSKVTIYSDLDALREEK